MLIGEGVGVGIMVGVSDKAGGIVAAGVDVAVGVRKGAVGAVVVKSRLGVAQPLRIVTMATKRAYIPFALKVSSSSISFSCSREVHQFVSESIHLEVVGFVWTVKRCL